MTRIRKNGLKPKNIEIAKTSENARNAWKWWNWWKCQKSKQCRKYQKLRLKFIGSICLVFIVLEHFNFGTEICNIPKLCKWWRRGGGGAQAVPRASALFLFQLFQIKMNQNRLTKFENSYFLLAIWKNRLKWIKNPSLHDSPKTTSVQYIILYFFGPMVPKFAAPYIPCNIPLSTHLTGPQTCHNAMLHLCYTALLYQCKL